MDSKKCLLVSTSYDDLLDSFSILKRTLKTQGYMVDELREINIKGKNSKEILEAYDYFFFVISNNLSHEVEIEEYLQILEEIQRSEKNYWSVCDQRTIYARTMLRDLKILFPYLDCVLYSVPEIIYLMLIYHMLTKETIRDPEKRSGNWVHPYRTTEELAEYFFTQIGYANG